MSLINDALKRATRNQQTPAAVPAPEPAAPMQPVEYRRSGGLPWYFIPAVMAIIAAACWFIVKGVQTRRLSQDPAASTILVKAREPQPEPSAPDPSTTPTAQAPAAIPTGTSSTTPATPNSTTTTVPGPAATEASASPPPAPAPPPEPPKPAYKLQGIFFRPENPAALVNGKTVSVGSRIDGATVKAITRDNLTLEVNGQTTVLTLE